MLYILRVLYRTVLFVFSVLHSGVLRGDLEQVAHALELAERLEMKHMMEERNDEGYTPLHLAIVNRDQHALR